MSSSPHRQIVDSLDRLRTGAASLTSEQYVHLLDTIEHISSVLHLAPRGSDPVATGVWYHHERGPALARLADALRVDGRATGHGSPKKGSSAGAGAGAPSDIDDERHLNAAVIRALQDSIQEV